MITPSPKFQLVAGAGLHQRRIAARQLRHDPAEGIAVIFLAMIERRADSIAL